MFFKDNVYTSNLFSDACDLYWFAMGAIDNERAIDDQHPIATKL